MWHQNAKITVRPRISPLVIGFVTWWHPPGTVFIWNGILVTILDNCPKFISPLCVLVENLWSKSSQYPRNIDILTVTSSQYPIFVTRWQSQYPIKTVKWGQPHNWIDPQFEKRVNHVAPAENGGGWRVSVVDLGTDEVTSDLFRAVLVCNGHYSIPAFADVDNLKEFCGKVRSCRRSPYSTNRLKGKSGFRIQGRYVMGRFRVV